jgi:hypothetical protein
MLEATERWSAYRLADGTTIRLKPVVIAVFRAATLAPIIEAEKHSGSD